MVVMVVVMRLGRVAGLAWVCGGHQPAWGNGHWACRSGHASRGGCGRGIACREQRAHELRLTRAQVRQQGLRTSPTDDAATKCQVAVNLSRSPHSAFCSRANGRCPGRSCSSTLQPSRHANASLFLQRSRAATCTTLHHASCSCASDASGPPSAPNHARFSS